MSQPNAQASSSKQQSKKDKSHSHSHSHKKDRTGSSHKEHHHHGSSKHDKSPFEHRLSRMRISVPPKFAGDTMSGVRENLDGMIMRYVPQMSGVLLAHWDHEFIDDTVKLINECPFGIVEVEFRSILWAPKIGQKLYGTHSLSSPSHLSLLFSKTFNISIPLQHIPTDLYEFEHTDEAQDDSDSEDEDHDDDGDAFGVSAVEDVGRWKEKATGKSLGEGGKGIKFTVIGVQVTNQMLSLTGSLLADPSNPPSLPETAQMPTRASPSPSPSPEPDVRPAKQARSTQTQSKRAAPRAQARQVEQEPEVDTSNFTARELKAYRKEQEKKKREQRKARKEEQAVLDTVQDIAGEEMVGRQGQDVPPHDEEVVGAKRKAAEDAGEKRKKKKKD
ncbi:hypothetical protein I316_02060 [Kwoniella heveanensis BCC8398]|uniref:Uncharacterized protein n=1 Tax=Kwoniella heveanensis BCC8398 TaxID=1296120 RepID=A0A1B9GYT0_9TREE|nr:hypothetical protein I316_02060 [Kwoniella heveanensis BCC8398]